MIPGQKQCPDCGMWYAAAAEHECKPENVLAHQLANAERDLLDGACTAVLAEWEVNVQTGPLPDVERHEDGDASWRQRRAFAAFLREREECDPA